jgi:hypothetical protein
MYYHVTLDFVVHQLRAVFNALDVAVVVLVVHGLSFPQQPSSNGAANGLVEFGKSLSLDWLDLVVSWLRWWCW